jgi:hypothetical protein
MPDEASGASATEACDAMNGGRRSLRLAAQGPTRGTYGSGPLKMPVTETRMRLESDTGGGNQTHTGVPRGDFKSAAAAKWVALETRWSFVVADRLRRASSVVTFGARGAYIARVVAKLLPRVQARFLIPPDLRSARSSVDQYLGTP